MMNSWEKMGYIINDDDHLKKKSFKITLNFYNQYEEVLGGVKEFY